jgi:hypothetical protein
VWVEYIECVYDRNYNCINVCNLLLLCCRCWVVEGTCNEERERYVALGA